MSVRYLNRGAKRGGVESFLTPSFSKRFYGKELGFGYQDNLGQRFKEDLTKWSLPVLLRYEDKNSGSFGLETRLPFLDYRLVEEVARMPLSQKMRNGWTKFILRQAMNGILSNKIRLRKSKLGFVTPEEIWYKNRLGEDINSVLKDAKFINNYVDTRGAVTFFQKHKASPNLLINNNVFFRMYILELWGRKFMLEDQGAL